MSRRAVAVHTRVLYDYYYRDFSPTLIPSYPPEELIAEPEALARSFDARVGGDGGGWAAVRAAAEALATAREAARRLGKCGDAEEKKQVRTEYRHLHNAFWDSALALPNRLHPVAPPSFAPVAAQATDPGVACGPGHRTVQLAGRLLEFVEPAGLQLQSRATALAKDCVEAQGGRWLQSLGPDWVTAPVLAACGWPEPLAVALPADKRGSGGGGRETTEANPHLRLFLVGSASLPAMAAQLGRRQAPAASLPFRLFCLGRLHANRPLRHSAAALGLLHASPSAADCDAAFEEAAELADRVWQRLAAELPLPGGPGRVFARPAPPQLLRWSESRRLDWRLEGAEEAVDPLASVSQLDGYVARRLMCLGPSGQPLNMVHACLLDCGALLRAAWPSSLGVSGDSS